MTMQLDVSVRLLDGLPKPAADTTKALEKFGAAVPASLPARAASPGDVRGLTGAMRGVRAEMVRSTARRAPRGAYGARQRGAGGPHRRGGHADAGGKHGGVQVASLQIHVHPSNGHSEKDIADAVHGKLHDSVRNHLSDEAFT